MLLVLVLVVGEILLVDLRQWINFSYLYPKKQNVNTIKKGDVSHPLVLALTLTYTHSVIYI